MSNIDKQALIEKIKKQTESFDTVVLREDEANALLDELESENYRADRATQECNRLLEALSERTEQCKKLAARHNKLRESMAAIHNTIKCAGAYTPLAAILHASKLAYEESAIAAGIGIKGE